MPLYLNKGGSLAERDATEAWVVQRQLGISMEGNTLRPTPANPRRGGFDYLHCLWLYIGYLVPTHLTSMFFDRLIY